MSWRSQVAVVGACCATAACAPAPDVPASPIPDLAPLPPELAPTVEGGFCGYRVPCLAPPSADDIDSDLQRFRVQTPCPTQVGAALDTWAKALRFTSGMASERRLNRFYVPEPQAFIELYYSVPNDGKSNAEVFVGIVASSPEQRTRIVRALGSPHDIAKRMRKAAESCDHD